ncbi:response regulator transcription factor [Thermocoleostomius sinensis A174]|uniref:Response regulator transcription factor n=1 Tax=Thermocoleostomius sinensis A174 TaxID=2016057 RepID=A0A9E8ZHI6_9CYAN|nr:response regulator transcription factor [Thermocoleostomius sinensis A174]
MSTLHLSANLSARELQVLKLLAEGYSNPEIATSLCISISTVKTHVRNILNKFGVNHRIQAVVLAVRSGLVD